MKKSKIIILVLLILYLVISIIYKPFVPCIIYELTGFYCPGCGVTRMIISIIKFDFYQAFRYNPLLFILLPFTIALTIDYLCSLIRKRVPIYMKINNKVWIVLIILLVLYGIVRNIYVPLAPTIL